MVKLRARDGELATECALLIRRMMPDDERARTADPSAQNCKRRKVLLAWVWLDLDWMRVKKKINGSVPPMNFYGDANVYGMGQSIERPAQTAWATKDQLWLPTDAPAATGNPASRGGFRELVCTLRIETRAALCRPKS